MFVKINYILEKEKVNLSEKKVEKEEINLLLTFDESYSSTLTTTLGNQMLEKIKKLNKVTSSNLEVLSEQPKDFKGEVIEFYIPDNIFQYGHLALRTAKPLPTKLALLHYSTGVITEFAEFLDVIKANVAYDKPFDKGNLIEEFGDAAWFTILHFFDTNLEKYQNQINVEDVLDYFEKLLVKMDSYPITKVSNEEMAKYISEGLHNITNFTCGFNNDVASYYRNMVDYLAGYYYYVKMIVGDKLNYKLALRINADKLRVRYPLGFSNSNAIERDTASEKKILS